MTDALSAIGQIIDRDVTQLRTVSQNVSNSSTPGYRAMSETQTAGSTRAEDRISMRAGSLMSTGRALDLAITGNGFFAVSTAQGLRYTRDGRFQLKADGTLATAAGDPVLGADGPLVLPGGSVSIGADGKVSAGKDTIARLRVVSFEDPTRLQPQGGGLYSSEADGNAAKGFQVHQGYLEGSNVDVSGELVNIIGLTRHLEAVQHGVMAYDQMLGSGINEIGKPRS